MPSATAEVPVCLHSLPNATASLQISVTPMGIKCCLTVLQACGDLIVLVMWETCSYFWFVSLPGKASTNITSIHWVVWIPLWGWELCFGVVNVFYQSVICFWFMLSYHVEITYFDYSEIYKIYFNSGKITSIFSLFSSLWVVFFYPPHNLVEHKVWIRNLSVFFLWLVSSSNTIYFWCPKFPPFWLPTYSVSFWRG